MATTPCYKWGMQGQPRGWVLYDGECRFCTRSVRLWTPAMRKRGFEPVPLQTDWVRERLGSGPELLRDIRLLLATGEIISGVDVYLYVGRRIWWASPFAWLFGLPLFKPVADAAYRWIASNRYCVAGRCELR